MKKLQIIFYSCFILLIAGCDKEMSGDNVLQGSFVPPFVDIRTEVGSIPPPTTATDMDFTFYVRSAFNKKDENVTITYNVSGVVTLTNQTVVIERNTLTTDVPITIPGNVVVPPATGKLTITITKAVLPGGELLRLGTQGTTNTPYSYSIDIAE